MDVFVKSPNKLKERGLLILLLFCSFFLSIAQNTSNNLVLNGDFEKINLMEIKPTYIDGQYVRFDTERDTSRFWSLTGNKKEHIKVSSKYWNGSLSNEYIINAGYSNTGNSLSGNFFGEFTPYYQVRKEEYRIKNIVGLLCKPLEAKNKYKLSFWIRPCVGNVFIDKVEVSFSSDLPPIYAKMPTNSKFIGNREIITIRGDDFKDPNKYAKLSAVYEAKGGEQFIIIGNPNFKLPKKIRRRKLKFYGLRYHKQTLPSCKYFIDDVSLVNIDDKDDSCPVNTTDNQEEDFEISDNVERVDSINYDTLITLEIFFDENSARVSVEQKQHIVTFFSKLNTKDLISIEIVGNASLNGSRSNNETLAMERAINVNNIIQSQIGLFDNNKIHSLGEDNQKYRENHLNRRVDVYIKLAISH